MMSSWLFCAITFQFLLAPFASYRRGAGKEEEVFDLITSEGFYKFLVTINSKYGVCTGTIVNEDWVLTAAHCLVLEGNVQQREDIEIIAGIANYVYPNKLVWQVRKIADVKIHPRFWDNVLAKFDIALVRVEKPFKFNNYVGSIAIAGDKFPRQENQTNWCMSFGFGGYRTITPTKKGSLKVWEVTPFYGPDSCPCMWKFQNKRLVCSRSHHYSRLCKGDDGGPLVCGNVVRAIAHMVRSVHFSRDATYPKENCVWNPDRGLEIYLLLCPFNNWMHGIVPDIPPTPPMCRGSSIASSLTAVIVSFLSFLLLG